MLGLGRQSLKNERWLGDTRFDGSEDPHHVLPALVDAIPLDLSGDRLGNVGVVDVVPRPPQLEVSASDARIELDIEQAGEAEHQVRLARSIANVDKRIVALLALQRADQHVNGFGDVAQQCLGERADAVGCHVLIQQDTFCRFDSGGVGAQ